MRVLAVGELQLAVEGERQRLGERLAGAEESRDRRVVGGGRGEGTMGEDEAGGGRDESLVRSSSSSGS